MMDQPERESESGPAEARSSRESSEARGAAGGARETRSGGSPQGADLLAVAYLERAHGIRGEMRALPLAPEVLDFEELLLDREVWIRSSADALRRARVVSMRPHQQAYLLTFEGIADREEAEAAFKKAEVCLAREELPELPEDWFWEEDLVGLAVHDPHYGEVGRVKSLEAIAGLANLMIAREGGGPAVQVPMVGGLIRRIDVGAGRIDLDLPLDYPGLEGA